MNGSKEHIMRTSLLLFLKKSYREVTMKEIVEKTGMSKGAFYHYFTGKEELFKEIVHMFFKMGAMDYSGFDRSTLQGFYRQYVEQIGCSFRKIAELVGHAEEEQPTLNFFLILFEAVGRFPEFLKIEREQYEREVSTWEEVIGHGRQTGEIKPHAEDRQIADLFLYCTDGVFIRYINSDKNSRYEDDLLKAFDVIYENLKS